MTINEKRRWSSKRGEGAAAAFIFENVGYDGDDCLIWPFNRQPSGYGSMGYCGKIYYAHRFMCEQINGPPPSDEHEAAHSCGRGKDGCVHPKHLSWKTVRGNALDSAAHGTASRNPWGNVGKLTRRNVAEIWAAKGKETQEETATRFGVSDSTIRDIYLGRSHRGFTAVAMLRLLSERDLSGFKNFANGAWTRQNLEALIDDLVADTNSPSVGQGVRDE